MSPQIQDNDPLVGAKVASNMRNIFIRVYVTGVFVIDLTFFFAGIKRTKDIRMLFDANVIRLKIPSGTPTLCSRWWEAFFLCWSLTLVW